MNKYNLGKIYKISNNLLTYIGSTCENLNKRLNRHERHYKSFLDGKHNYLSSFDIIKDGEYKIELIENFSCNSKSELCERENHFLKSIECINKYKSFRTLEDKLEQRKKDNLLFRLNSPEKYHLCQERRNIKWICKCGNECSKRNKARHIKTCNYKE